jgi:hypothetical protein
MKTNDDVFALALRQTFLATAGQADPDTDNALPGYLLLAEGGTDSYLSEAGQKVHQRLVKRLTTSTLGQLLTQATDTLTPARQTEQTGLVPETLDELRADRLHPTAVPVMRMKRLVQFLNLHVDEARAVLQKTADWYREQFVPTQYGYALTGRIASPERSTSTMQLGSRSLFETDEALHLYLNRLAEELTTDPGTDIR